MGTKKVDTEIRREQIALAALSLVEKQGLQAVTVTRVARLVGLVPSALYRHFKGKDQIIDAVLDLIEEQMITNLAEIDNPADDPVAVLRNLLMRQVQMVLQYQAIPHFLFSEEVFNGRPKRKKKFFNLISTFLNGVASIIRRGQEQGNIRQDRDAKSLATLFIGLFHPAFFLWHLSDGQFDLTRQINLTWESFVDAVVRCDRSEIQTLGWKETHRD
ncbi:MAG: TetR/AcrR family transcriptional regulator [Phycisphaerae bacterium]|jgi:AcrR family transcriptional regulator|nr:TetR/AcrR family transcriptional regulator [Phycisphaerae bacterium]